MGLRNTRDGWGAVARTLHWTVAALVVAMVPLGWVMTGLDHDPVRQFALYQLHKSIGLVVLALMALRVAWRAHDPPPALPATVPAWERRAAMAGHAGLYALLLALPATGWLAVSASPLQVPTLLFGVVPVPHLLSPDEELADALEDLHDLLSNLLLALLAVHVVAALKHHWIDRDDVLRRMLSGRPQGRRLP